MQPDPVDSTKMFSVADNCWDEQDQYELNKYKDRLLRLKKNLELLRKERPLDDFHDHLERRCMQQLQRLHEQEIHDSLQRKWETGEGLDLLVMKALEDLGKVQGFLNLPKDEIERLYNLPEFRRQIERLPRQSLQEWQHELLCIERAYLRSQKGFDKFSWAIDTNNVFPTIYGTSPVVTDINTYFSCSRIHRSKNLRKGSCICSVPFNTSTNKTTSGTIPATPGPREKGFVLHSANSVRKNIFTLSTARDGGSSSDGTGFALSGDNSHGRETDSATDDMPEVILDNQAQVNCTGNFEVLSNVSIGPKHVVLIAANGEEMPTYMSGLVRSANYELNDVHYCPDLGNRIIVSGSMLDNDDYGYQFGYRRFTVKDLKTGTTIGEGRLVDGNYILDYPRIPRDRTPRLVTTVWNAVCSALHRLGLKY